ncbi:MAG: hypothetical protein QOD99_2687, partial [Chthoniobacter sp.]|nr:hypothetical protein [Chthoniobacter sp.]
MMQLLFSWLTRKPAPVAGDAELEKNARDLLRGIGCTDLAERVCVRWNKRLRTT